jgi:predicted transcriptional regulator of viral defense system
VLERKNKGPSWDRLFEIAVTQEGLFATEQAALAGYSPQLLAHHLRAGRIVRVRRGVYRIVHFPAGEHEDLVALWLWSTRAAVFSHHTALALHDLSDILPSRVHITVPRSWEQRRVRPPPGVKLHYADLTDEERVWMGSVPITSTERTIADCVSVDLGPDLIDQAVRQALARGLISPADAARLRRAQRARRKRAA